MTKTEVINLLKTSKNSSDWNSNCEIIKKAHNNGYPNYWFQEVILSGLCDEILGAGSSTIKVSSL